MKLPQISGKDLVKKLQHAGFIVLRQRGSHVRLEKRQGDKLVKITVPLHPVLKKGTLHHILQDAGITSDEFAKL